MRAFILSCQLISVLVLLACGGRPGETNPDPGSPATLQVENQGFTDMVIYAVSGAGQRTRLGLVTGNSSQTFTIPSYLVRGAGPIRFLADPIGGTGAPVSEEILVRPGDTVGLTIPPS